MVKKAFCMKVYPEKQEEYKKRHDELWPEMRTALREHGVIDYSIYLDPSTSLLFGYLVIEDESYGKNGKYIYQSKMVEVHGRYHGDKSRCLSSQLGIDASL